MATRPPSPGLGQREPIDAATRTALEASLGDRIVTVDVAPWGFSTATQTIGLASGDRVAIQRRSSRETVRIRRASRVLAAAGIRVPAIRAVVHVARRTWLVYEAVEGRPGPELLTDQRGSGLAREMGRTLDRISAIHAADVPVDPAWCDAARLRAAVARWERALPSEVRSDVQESAARLARRPWRVTISHGDFVPANVIAGEDGQLVILDLAEVAGRHPLVDPAWWELIVRHHHPALAGLATNLRRSTGGTAVGAAPAGEPEAGWHADAAVIRAAQMVVRAPRRREHHLALLGTAIRWLRATDGTVPTAPAG